MKGTPLGLTYHTHAQIYFIPLENWVFLLVKDDDYVTRLNARFLVTLASKCYLLSIPHTLVDVNFQDFTFFDCFSTLTVLTAIFF